MNRPSPVRSPDNRKQMTLERIRNSLSASNPALVSQLSQSAPQQSNSYLQELQQQQKTLMWNRREPRQHISSVCSVEASSIADEVREMRPKTSCFFQSLSVYYFIFMIPFILQTNFKMSS